MIKPNSKSCKKFYKAKAYDKKFSRLQIIFMFIVREISSTQNVIRLTAHET